VKWGVPRGWGSSFGEGSMKPDLFRIERTDRSSIGVCLVSL
jgi:hypothetical protein